MKGDYITLKQRASDEFVEKKSRFIGYACPVETEEQAVAFINEIRTKHRDARHNVYAYIVNNNGVVNQRYSDDGEPQGTGGMPVMDVIMKQGLVNCCVVVTRYFGGILLGASGLVRAYSHGASIAVEAAGILKVIECKKLKVIVPYGIYDRLMSYFVPFGYTQISADFSTEVAVVYDIPAGEVEARQAEIIDMTNGRAIVEILKD
ncbi:MAG: YigZ family protein [Ruminococcaceae bacterium]|nr:YigZ family protein [Oscillospiraceae bacterium]